MKRGLLSQIWLVSFKNEMLLATIASLIWAILSIKLALDSNSKSSNLMVNISYILAYRGFLLIGWEYNLKGMRRGARLLMLAGLLGIFLGNEVGYINKIIFEIIKLLGVIILFVDMIPLQIQFNKFLILILIFLEIGSKFLLKLGWLTPDNYLLTVSICGFLIAYLFWSVSTRNPISF